MKLAHTILSTLTCKCGKRIKQNLVNKKKRQLCFVTNVIALQLASQHTMFRGAKELKLAYQCINNQFDYLFIRSKKTS